MNRQRWHRGALTVLISLGCVGFLATSADAQILDDDAEELAPVPTSTEPAEDPRAVHWGVGLRLREIIIPKGEIELFVEEAASGSANLGFGIEGVRRRENFELVLGFEYESISPDDGYYLESGGNPTTPGTVDFVEFDGLAFMSLDVTFVFHKPLHEMVALRYGGGFGLGLLLGTIYQTDSICSGADLQRNCTPNGAAPREEANLPPVFPVVTGLVGVQFRPLKQLHINLEGGLRTAFFVGTSADYYF